MSQQSVLVEHAETAIIILECDFEFFCKERTSAVCCESQNSNLIN